MGYIVNGSELDTDEQGFLLEADFSDEVVKVIAAAEQMELTDDHWKVVAYLRDEYREHLDHLVAEVGLEEKSLFVGCEFAAVDDVSHAGSDARD